MQHGPNDGVALKPNSYLVFKVVKPNGVVKGGCIVQNTASKEVGSAGINPVVVFVKRHSIGSSHS